MDAVESVRDALASNAAESERIGTLAPASVAALYESGLLRLKMPHALGGAEADPVTQLDVLEAVSRIDPSSGWCLMIGAASLGGLGAFLPDDSIAEVFAGGRPPKVAGAAAPSGTAAPVAGGYRVTGHWQFGSGIRHAEWVSAGARGGQRVRRVSASAAADNAPAPGESSRQLAGDGTARHRQLRLFS